MRRSTPLLLVALVGLVLPASRAPSSHAAGYKATTTTIAPGVTLTKIKDPKGPFRIKVVAVDISAPSTIDVVLAQDRLKGFETTSSLARRYGALAAINGDYATPSGRPVMSFAQDGRLAQTPLYNGRNFAIRADETATYVARPAVSAWVADPSGSWSRPVAVVNDKIPDRDQLGLYPIEGQGEIQPPRWSCSARLAPATSPQLLSMGPGIEQSHIVQKVSCSSQRMSRRGGVVLATWMWGKKASFVRGLQKGSELTLGWSLGWDGVMDTIGGDPTLVENGKIPAYNVDGEGYFYDRHPRTAVATTTDGQVLLVTVDGRQEGYSVGMSPRRFARLLVELGAARALNLDGGGSTTMVVDGDVINRPSDGPERAVSSALLVLPGSDSGETSDPEPAPGDPISRASDPWEWIVSDPASTGGLAAMLEAAGATLPPSLARIADGFERRATSGRLLGPRGLDTPGPRTGTSSTGAMSRPN